MRILLTGGTGFIGKALVLRLQRDGHRLVVWTRSPSRARDVLGPDVEITGAQALRQAIDGCDAIVNLAGENLFTGRWTEARKRELVDSRVRTTDALVEGIAAAQKRPRALLSASAVGYYGDRGDTPLDEDAAPGADFLADLCQRWERAAFAAEAHDVRVAVFRFGIVLGIHGGALSRLIPVFSAGVGGPLGSGRQFFPWIHRHDLVDVLARAVSDERYQGAINTVSPEAVRNAELARTLGVVLHRPAFLGAPAFALELVLGEAASALLSSQRVVPRRLGELGFPFRYAQLRPALEAIAYADAGVEIHRRGDGYRLSLTTAVGAPRAEVFAFFSQAGNLGVITPPGMGFALLSPRPVHMAPEVMIAYRIRLGPVGVRWRSKIEVWEPEARFVDVQERGPYRRWRHEHRFRVDGDRTLVEDLVDYAPPLGPLGRLANELFVDRQLRSIFGYRADAICLRFGPGA